MDGSKMFAEGWNDEVARSENAPAIDVDRLAPGALIGVRTGKAAYMFRVIDPERLCVEVVIGAADLLRGMTGHLIGSCFTYGGTMRRAWIAVGYHVVFGSEEFPFLPAYVELEKTLDVTVNGVSVVPVDGVVN